MKSLTNYINEKLVINRNTKVYTEHPKTRDELVKILKERLHEDKNADLNDIDVSDIDDMSFLFYWLDPHNIDISEWDVSNVKNMKDMFLGCKNFNSDISEWDVSNVENMRSMFNFCSNFNSDLSKWNIRKVKDMRWMFNGCKSLKNIPDWYKE